MKSVFFNRSSKTSVDSVMTPMIDVVFLLLIFFLSTASFQRLEKTLPSAVASEPEKNSQGNQPQTEPPSGLSDLSDVVIKIHVPKESLTGTALPEPQALTAGSLAYLLNDDPIANFDLLSQRLAAILKIRSDIPIIIDPDGQVPAGEAIRVYDVAKTHGSVAVYLVAK